jgi:hypothetical protein
MHVVAGTRADNLRDLPRAMSPTRKITSIDAIIAPRTRDGFSPGEIRMKDKTTPPARKVPPTGVTAIET